VGRCADIETLALFLTLGERLELALERVIYAESQSIGRESHKGEEV
jgi:hypothetical protein